MGKLKWKWLPNLARILLLIGGLNWGLVGLFGFNLVEWLSFGLTWLQNTVYILVGVSAIIYAIYDYGLAKLFK